MKMEELQTVNKKEVSEKVRNYWLFEAACIVGSVLVLILDLRFQFYLNYLDDMYLIPPFFWILGMLFSLVGTLGIIFLLLILSRRNAMKLIEILGEECDPFLYEVCCHKTRVKFLFKNQNLCNLMLAQYYQGNYEEAWNTAGQIQSHKLKGIFRANYYIIKCGICFKRGMEAQARELEEEFRHRIGSSTDKKNMQILCANNNLQRAYDNKDYTLAYGFLQECTYLSGRSNRTMQKVLNSFWEARLAFARGGLEEAKVKAGYASRYGGRTVMAKEAGEMLDEIAAKEQKVRQNGDDGMTGEEKMDESK